MDNTHHGAPKGTHKLSTAAVLPFLLAGRSLVTVLNRTTDGHYTYRIQAPGKTAKERRNASILFVSVLTGPDNGERGSYTYIGILIRQTGEFKLTAKSRLPKSSASVAGFDWLCRQARRENLDSFPHVEVRHHNECGACARTLTVPESIDTGLGPICAKRLGAHWARNDQRKVA